MRLLFLTNLYPPYELGGFEQWCQEVTILLKKRGHQVVILTSRYGIDQDTRREEDVIRSLYLQAGIHYYYPVDFIINHTKQEQANETELKRVLGQYTPDLVVVWGMWNLSPNLASLAEKWMPGRVAYYIASYWPTDHDIHQTYWMARARRTLTEWAKRPLRSFALAKLSRNGYPPHLQFEHVMCCSKYVRDTLVLAGKLSNNSSVLYGGIDPYPFINNPIEKEALPHIVQLLYFGGLYPHKGAHTAIEALRILKEWKLLDRVKLTLLGSGHPEYETRLQQQSINLGLETKIKFSGRVPRKEIPDHLRNFDIFLFTSIWPEPMARTVMEAMAAELLVIGTEVGGQKEMLYDGINSLTFQPEDATGLANQIRRVLEEPPLRVQLGQAGRQTILERFTLERMVDNMEIWWMDILSKTQAGMYLSP